MSALVRLCMLGLCLLAGQGSLLAQTYPERSIKFIVPFPPGGPADLVARTLASKLTISLGKSVIVENRSGAGGNIATDEVAKAAPDGLTLLLATNGPLVVNQALYGTLPFDPQKDFATVSQIAEIPLAVLVHPSLPVNSMQELIAYAKAHPGQLSYASSGAGSGGHLSGALIAQMAQIDLAHVPYRGLAPATSDLFAGHVKMMVGGLFSALPYVEAGKLKALAVATPKRVQSAPNLPTVAETGLTGFEIVSWYGVVVPAKTPQPIIDRLYQDLMVAVNSPDVQERLFEKGGLEKIANSPSEFAAVIAREIPQYAHIVKITGAKAE